MAYNAPHYENYAHNADRKPMPQRGTGRPGGKLPSMIAFDVVDHEGGKAVWTRIGAAWNHQDGKGMSLKLEGLPADGRVVLRVPSAKDVNHTN